MRVYPTRGVVDQVAHALRRTVQEQLEVSAEEPDDVGPALGGVPGDVGRDQEVRRIPQRAVGWERLRVGDVDHRTSQATVPQGVVEGGLVDQPSPCHVDEQGRWLHRRELGGADQVSGGPVQRCAEHDDVARRQELTESLRRQQAVERLAGDEQRTALRGPDLHPERPGRGGELTADRAVPDDPQALPAEDRAPERVAVEPSTLALTVEPRRQAPAEHDDRRERVLRHRGRVRAGRVREEDAALRHRLEGEVFDAGRDAVDPADAGRRDRPLQQSAVDPGDDDL